MNKDFNSINKQIAGFIVLSAAVAAPVVVPNINGTAQAEPAMIIKNDIQFTEIQPSISEVMHPKNTIYRYAGPEMVDPKLIKHFNESEMSGGSNMIKIDPSIYVARYAGPETPDINNGIPPIVRYAGPQRPSSKKKFQQRDEYGLSKLESGHYIYK